MLSTASDGRTWLLRILFVMLASCCCLHVGLCAAYMFCVNKCILLDLDYVFCV